MHVNYEYILNRIASLPNPHEAVVLDYGCGSGEVVEEGRRRGFNVYGTEVFYAGGNTKEVIAQKELLGSCVREMVGDRIPFCDQHFDLVVSNQVFEHVQDLRAVLAEIDRVLKPSGHLLCLFPSRDILREGHCGVPLTHWFPKYSRLRYPYLMLMRRLGLGYFTENKTPSQWSIDFMHWLDQFTFYRSRQEIFDCFSGFHIQLIEDDYVAFRLRAIGQEMLARFARLYPIRYLTRGVFRKLGGLVILARKRSPSCSTDGVTRT